MVNFRGKLFIIINYYINVFNERIIFIVLNDLYWKKVYGIDNDKNLICLLLDIGLWIWLVLKKNLLFCNMKDGIMFVF